MYYILTAQNKEASMATHYHPTYLRQRMQQLKYRFGGVTDDPDLPHLCKEWFEDPDTFTQYIGEKPKPDYVLIHLDKSKWYGPGNVKWGSMAKARALRVDSPKLRAYYEGKVLAAPKSARPADRSLRDWSRCSGVSLYMLERAKREHPTAPMDRVVDIARGYKIAPKWSSGRPAALYEGKSISQWSVDTGVPDYFIRKHLSQRPMSEIIELAQRNYMEGQRAKRKV